MSENEVVLRERGVLTLPKGVRQRNKFEPGTHLRVIELGEGAVVLARQKSVVAELAEQIEELLEEAGITLQELLRAAREERGRIYRQRYGGE